MKKLLFYLAIFVLSSPLVFGAASVKELVLSSDHWAYDYMSQLSGAGLIENYPDQYIKEFGKEISRYELANYLKGLIIKLKEDSRNIRLNKSQEYILNRLIVEFKMELSDLGMSITYLEPLSPARQITPAVSFEGKEYEDIDTLLHLPTNQESGVEVVSTEEISNSQTDVPYYYFGTYNTVGIQHDYFLFIPDDFLNDKQVTEERWEVIYQVNKGKRDTFLMVKGGLPLKDNDAIEGYYLFPLDLEDTFNGNEFDNVEETAFTLLTSLYETYRINDLQQIEGTLPLNHFFHLDPTVSRFGLINEVDIGVQIGDLIVSTGFGMFRTKEGKDISLQKWGVKTKTWDWRPKLSLNAIYLSENNNEEEDVFKRLNLELLGSLPLTESTEIYGGFSWGYEQEPNYLRKMSVVNSLVNAGVSFKLNDYLRLMADFTYYNDINSGGDGSFTSLGLEWGEKSLLILGLQMLSVEEPQITGELSLRF